jgi:hypothetical protein
MIQYHNAFDISQNVIIHISEVIAETRKNTQFFCVGCGMEMEAVLGKQKEHHFRHKEKCNCSPETYYHRLWKIRLKRRFDEQLQFLVNYYVQNNCYKYEECQIKEKHNWLDCSAVVLKTIDLKEFYDTCEEEGCYNRFRADLKLTHSQYPDRHPVFLEVSVTHDCEQNKIDSKIRIIEIKIQSELEALSCYKRELTENEGKFIEEFKIIKSNNIQQLPVRYYNFKRQNKASHNLSRFSLHFDENNKFYHGILKPNTVSCQDFDTKHEDNSVFEITISEDKIPQKQYGNLDSLGIALAHKRGFEVKSCILCTWYNHRYEKCIITYNNKEFYACQLTVQDIEQLCPAYCCSKFQVYGYAVQKIISKFNNIPYSEWSNNNLVNKSE